MAGEPYRVDDPIEPPAPFCAIFLRFFADSLLAPGWAAFTAKYRGGRFGRVR